MAMYHISPETGNPGACKAKEGNCPFGGESKHYETEGEARKGFENEMDLRMKATSDDARTRWAVAKDENTPADVLEKLASDAEHPILVRVADNPNTPPHCLAELSKVDDSSKIRCAVAANPSTPAENLEKLLSDPHGGVRLNALSNESTPLTESNLKSLRHDDHSRIRLRAVAKSSSLTPDEYLELSADSDSEIRGCIAEDSRAPAEILEVLAKDKEMSVRRATAKNPSTPLGSIIQLARNKQTRYSVAGDSRLPREVIAKLSLECQKGIPGHRDDHLAMALATNRNTPSEVLMTLGSHEQLEGMYGNPAKDLARYVAWNPNLTKENLEELAAHGHDDIRPEAKAAIESKVMKLTEEHGLGDLSLQAAADVFGYKLP